MRAKRDEDDLARYSESKKEKTPKKENPEVG